MAHNNNAPIPPLGINNPPKSTKTVSMLTTFDNPFDPFEDFARWFVYDSEKGYNTCGLLAIASETSDSFIEESNLIIDENLSLSEEELNKGTLQTCALAHIDFNAARGSLFLV